MAYLDQILQPEEAVIVRGRLHWIVYVKAKFFLLVDLALLGGYLLYPHLMALGIAAALLLPVWLFLLLRAWVRRATTEIAVTNRRVIFKTGLISRKTVEMNLSKVETVDVVQSIMGRMFGYGTLLVRGTGSTYEPLSPIADPLAVRNAITAG